MRPISKPSDCRSFKAFLGDFITQWIQVRATAMRKICTRQWTNTNNQNSNLHCLFYYTTVQNTMQKMLHGVKYIKDNKSKTLVTNYYSKRIKAKYLLAMCRFYI